MRMGSTFSEMLGQLLFRCGKKHRGFFPGLVDLNLIAHVEPIRHGKEGLGVKSARSETLRQKQEKMTLRICQCFKRYRNKQNSFNHPCA